MNFFSRLSFHYRIFVVVGLFVAVSFTILWFFVRPLYEHQVIEERTTVVQELKHFASRSIDEKLEQWIDISRYLAWNLQTHPAEAEILMRQQIAFDTAIVQIIVSSSESNDEYVITNSLFPKFSFTPAGNEWMQTKDDSTIQLLWSLNKGTTDQIFGIRKLFLIDQKPYIITLFANTNNVLSQLNKLPVGGQFIVQVGNGSRFVFNNSTITFPVSETSLQNLSMMQDVSVENTQWKVFTSKFSSVPMYLLIAIPMDVILQPVHDLFIYSSLLIFGITSFVIVFAWIFSRQLSQPITDLVRDVERLSTLDFSQPISIPQLNEIAKVAATVESMRTVLERYQRINVEKIIFEEWKNRFFLLHSEDGISITDSAGTFTFMNERFIGLRDELHKSGPVSNKLSLMAHPHIKRTKETSREEISGSYTVTFHQSEIAVEIPEREHSFFRLHDVTIANENDNLGSLIVLHDQTNERLIEKMKTEMMNFIVHELRNPLNSIMGFSSFMIDEPEMATDERSEYVRIIQESSRTMNQLVNRFLEVQRLESRTVDYHKEDTDLAAVAKLVCDSQKPQLQAKSLQLQFTAEENIPTTIVAPDLMREAFLNLVSNAVKYGDENRTITVELKRSNDNILFIITDHGYGISIEDQEKLFSKFFRVTSNKKAAGQLGTGLGLAHVKEVMMFHKGDVTLESNNSIGCRFTLTIPIV
jgi:signal transduction histidine kinase